MNDLVTHPGNFSPRNSRVGIPALWRDVAGSFPDHLHQVSQCEAQVFVGVLGVPVNSERLGDGTFG